MDFLKTNELIKLWDADSQANLDREQSLNCTKRPLVYTVPAIEFQSFILVV